MSMKNDLAIESAHSDILKLAQSWLEHCREEIDYFFGEGEDDTAAKWNDEAEKASDTIKRYIDTMGLS